MLKESARMKIASRYTRYRIFVAAVGLTAVLASGFGIAIARRSRHAKSSPGIYVGVSSVEHAQNLRLVQDSARQTAAVEATVTAERYSFATGGTLFTMEKVRTYAGQRLGPGQQPSEMLESPEESTKCSRWAVITSIFEPTDTVRQLAALADWRVVVVGDKNGESLCALICC